MIRMPRLTNYNWVVSIGLSVLFATLVTAGFAVADVSPGNVGYDNRFVFVRLKYEMPTGLQTGFFRQDIKWAHDYPRAEQNLMKILDEVSLLKVGQGPNGGNVLALDDPELYKFPFAYMAEPGFWFPTDNEVEGLQVYLRKGGFVIFDDFTADHWYNFTDQMERVLPGLRPMELDIAHPVFQSFFETTTLEMAPMYGPPPTFWGYFEDNDQQKRLLALANYENDIGEYWEYSDTGWFPIDLTNDAYKFGVNYVIYSLTH